MLLHSCNFRFFHFSAASKAGVSLAMLWLSRPESCCQRCPAASEKGGYKGNTSQVRPPWREHGQHRQASHAIDKLSHSSEADLLTFICIAFSSAEYPSYAVYNRLPLLTHSSFSVKMRGEAPYLCTLRHTLVSSWADGKGKCEVLAVSYLFDPTAVLGFCLFGFFYFHSSLFCLKFTFSVCSSKSAFCLFVTSSTLALAAFSAGCSRWLHKTVIPQNKSMLFFLFIFSIASCLSPQSSQLSYPVTSNLGTIIR